MSDATLKNLNACDIGAGKSVVETDSLTKCLLGTGQVTLALAPVFNSIHAIDTSPSMLKRLAARFPDNGNVTYSLLSLSLHAIDLLRSGASLPAPTDEDETRQRVPPRTTFDIVYGSLMLHHVEDLESFFAGLQELVKPGGWVIFSEFGSAEEDRLAVAQAEAEAGISEEEAALQGKIAFPVGIVRIWLYKLFLWTILTPVVKRSIGQCQSAGAPSSSLVEKLDHRPVLVPWLHGHSG